MLKTENEKVFGILDALRGMRNPLNSWDKLDSSCVCDSTDGHILSFELGPNDTKLCTTLIDGGQPHRKFLRQINVTMDIIAPTYWWAEMDTYKVGTTRNSCSIQHKGASRDFDILDFELECMNASPNLTEEETEEGIEDAKTIISIVNKWRRRYISSPEKNYSYFRLMRQYIPMSYNYKATWSGTYETLLSIYEWRKNHRLVEWHDFCRTIEKLPLMDIFLKDKNNVSD